MNIKKHLWLSIYSILIAALFLSGCGGELPLDSSIQAWVEYPYDGATLPMGPVTLVVYASSEEGISAINIDVNGQTFTASQVTPLTSDGSSKLVRVDYPFTPQEVGEYVVTAQGVALGGSSGGSGSTRFCIVSCNSGFTATPAANEDVTATPASDVTGTPTAAGGITITSTATQANQPVVVFTSTPTLVFDTPPLEPPPPPADTSGPSINSVSTFWYPEGCSLFGTAEISDPSGVSWGEFHFNLNGNGWAWIKMNQQGGNTWTSQVGVDTGGIPGTIEYKVRTLDTLNNETWSGVSTKNFAYCGD